VIGLPILLLGALVQSVPPPVRSLDKGSQSRVSTARQLVVREPGEWASTWHEHAQVRPQPAVDFSREMVVGVFLGTRPTAGYAVEIVGYQENGEDVVVQYRELAPSRDLITAQVLTSPYHLVVIPRRSGTVTFEKLKT
jgi:hypothetical protein